jgi:hypothetical protein
MKTSTKAALPVPLQRLVLRLWRGLFARANTPTMNPGTAYPTPPVTIQRIKVYPGDVVVATVPHFMSQASVNEMKATLHRAFGENVKTIILCGGVEVSVISPQNSPIKES